MASHRFRVGQVVDYTSLAGVPASDHTYKILRLAPRLEGEQRYWIKTITEPLARVARESQLALGHSRAARSCVLQYCAR